jgi:hypothetical protein
MLNPRQSVIVTLSMVAAVRWKEVSKFKSYLEIQIDRILGGLKMG